MTQEDDTLKLVTCELSLKSGGTHFVVLMITRLTSYTAYVNLCRFCSSLVGEKTVLCKSFLSACTLSQLALTVAFFCI